MKDRGVLFTREVAALAAPARDGGGDASHQLANARLTRGSPFLAVEVFGSDDIRGRHRPGLRHFDILLFEYDFPGLAGDRSGPVFPLDRVIGREAFARE